MIVIVCLFIGFFFNTFLYAKPVEITLWHSLAGSSGKEVQALAQEFNQSQTEFLVTPVYKGDYIESLTSFAAAFRAHQAPALMQVFEVGTKTMQTPAGVIKPVDELMQEQGLSLPQASFFPTIVAYYSSNGHLMAMPFNVSVPALFYNADALASLGYSKEMIPRTWDEFETLAGKLKQSGFSCVYTSTYPAWILIESFSAVEGLPMIDKTTGDAIYNNTAVIRHLGRLRRWQQLHYFEYGGRMDNAMVLFTSGKCPFLSQSSGAYHSLSTSVPFQVGIATLPREHLALKNRFNNVAGGAALWVVSGQTDAVYRGIATFFSYFVRPKVQHKWHLQTGYLPLGVNGIYKELLGEQEQSIVNLLQSELAGNHDERVVLPLEAQNQIRVINDEALESLFAGMQTPTEAMNEAVLGANHAMRRFTQITSNASKAFRTGRT